jgi:hypothetical protein
VFSRSTKNNKKPHLILARIAKPERKPRVPLDKHSEDMAPVFIEKPENKVIMESQLDFVEAVIDGEPFPSYTWYKGNRECFDGPKYSFECDRESGVVTMWLNRPKMDDEAKYSLKIFNALGEERQTFSIFVRCIYPTAHSSLSLSTYHSIKTLIV